MRSCCFVAFLTIGCLWSAPAMGQPAQGPPRDRSGAPQTGTAIIRGRVFAGDTGKPLRRARVTASSAELTGAPRNASTDLDGAYELTDLPAGRYTLRVQRGGYLPLQYGQRRPLEQGKPLELLDKQVLDKVDFSLPRMSTITGRVVDELGDPIEGVQVLALRMMYFNGRRQLTPVSGNGRSNEDGEFRLSELAPGTYYVSATTRDTWTVSRDGVKQVMGYAPTYYPGTPRVTEARRFDLKQGQSVANADIALVPANTATISGTAIDSHGKPYTDVNLRAEVRGETFAMFGSAGQAHVLPDGTFRIPNVPPGDYILASGSGRDSAEPEVALLPITVDGTDIDGVTLTGSRGGTISGRVVTEDGEVPSIPRLSVTAVERTTGQADPTVLGTFRNAGSGIVGADGAFKIDGVFGHPRLRVTLPDTWAVKSIERDGRDIADDTLDVRPGETLTDVQVVVTNRVSVVTGTLADERGRPVADGTVIVFAEDASKWGPDGRMIRAARPDQQGQWRINGLPPGKFLAVALEYVENGLWNDPEYLETLRQYGKRVELNDRDRITIDLKFVTP